MASSLIFWLCFGGYLIVGMGGTFGLEVFVNRKNADKRRMFLLFGVAALVNLFLIPLFLDMVEGNGLTVAQSNAISESTNFLDPLEQVFQFLEDGVTVRIAAALGNQDFAEAGALIKMAIYAGLGSGALGAFVTVPLAFIKPIFAFFVPYSMGSNTPPDCPSVTPPAADMQATARPYWVLAAVAFPFVFASKCSLAFFLGSQSFLVWIGVGVAAGLLGLLLEYVFLFHVHLGATGVGLAGLITSIVFVGATVFFLTRPTLKEKYQLFHFRIEKRHHALLIRSAKDGLKLMSKDLLSSIKNHLPSMFTAQLDLGMQYALGLLDKVSTQLSVFSSFIGIVTRLRCASLLGKGAHHEFREKSRGLIQQALIVGLAGTAAAMLGYGTLAQGFASDSLKSLKDQPCAVATYNVVFDSVDGPTYWLMAIMITVSSLNNVYNSLLYAFRDFSFILRVGALSFVLGVPLQLLAFLNVQTLFSIYLASSIPGVVTTCLFMWRFHFVLLKQLPLEDTHGEVPLLPEHGFGRSASKEEGLLAMADEDINNLIGTTNTDDHTDALLGDDSPMELDDDDDHHHAPVTVRESSRPLLQTSGTAAHDE